MCWKCGTPIDESLQIYRTSECPVCGADLHCCRNCRFYSRGSHYDCLETVSEPVGDKERANFCDSFSVCSDSLKKGAANTIATDRARDAFNDLFGGIVCL